MGLLGEDGELLGRYRKMHLFPYGSREAELLTPGEAAAVIHTRLGRIGLATCFDLRFPEQFAEMRELGADLFVVPAAWPAGRVGDWEILIRARAMENQLPLVGCNGVGDCAGVELGGSSLVVDGRGRPLAAASKDPSSLSAVIDHEATARWRRDFPMRARPAALPA